MTEKNLTKKKKLIIETSSSSKNSERSNSKRIKKRDDNNNKTKKKKKKNLIIESSSTPFQLKDKIESNLNVDNKIDLNITQNCKIMSSSGRLNEPFIELMEQLSVIMLKHGEPFRARAYQKAQETMMSYPKDITSPKDLEGKPGIGSTIMEKLNEYCETGTLKVLEREKNNPVNILADVYGIGPKKAKELVDKGITTIAQLRDNQSLLNDNQKVGVKYYEDILKRIPRAEIEQYKAIFETDFKKVSTPNSRFEIVGSYRRGAESSGDIDVIVTSDTSKVFINFIDLLIQQKIIIEVLSRGPTKCLVIAKLPNSPDARRVDFLYTTLDEYPFSVLYFTGSKIFNTMMRHEALTKGLTMNEHGLYTLSSDKKTKGEKVEHVFKDEKDIFDYLNMEYKSPKERVDGRAIVLKNAKKKPLLIIEDDSLEQKDKKEEKEIKKEKNLDSSSNSKKIMNDFKKNGIKVLEGLNENQLVSLVREANKAYYNDKSLMSDNEFDIVKEYIENKYPSNSVINEIGAPIEKNKVKLPYQMASMDKIKPDTNALVYWMLKYKGPYVLSCKLDGVSGLYSTEGPTPKLYTRGDGKVGQDISHLIPHLRLPKTKGIVIRGEFIIPKAVFEVKYKNMFANPRNMVAGIVNQKTITVAIKDLHFVAYEVIKPVLKPVEQMEYLGSIDVEGVLYKIGKSLSNEILSQILVEWRTKYIYEIDGIIVTNDAIYERKTGNPEHAFAFKMVLSDQIAEAKVVDVIWTPSKDGYLKPRVQIEPIHLGGVTIEYATGFNGAFIEDNKVGVGAVIELIRSGDVIPHIRKVNVPAEQAKMPDVPYKWNETHVDIMLEDIDTNETVKEKVVTAFFRGIGVDGLSSGNVARIMQTGYDSVPAIIKMSVADFLKVPGFKDKTANKIYDGIHEKLKAVSLVTLMSASNLLGRGISEKKMELILDPETGYPNILLAKIPTGEKIAKVASIKGMGEKSAELFVERIPAFLAFIKEAGLDSKLVQGVGVPQKKTYDESHPLYGKTIVMTGFRDAELGENLKNLGAKVGASVSKNTFIVLVKDKEEDTGKADEARKLNVVLMTPEEFKHKYLNK
jgi:NAD-dependent DNA ligase/DNA polymerase/3'-5' exonuclease PolX